MTKQALRVGINDYPLEGADLRGCINDATGWRVFWSIHSTSPGATSPC